MLAEYSGVLVILAIALILAGAMLTVHLLLGPRRRFAEKLDPFESGERPLVSPKQRFSVKFYMVALLFIVFDLEVVFFYPWAALFRDLGWFGFWAMGVFAVPLVVALVYEWTKGTLEW